MERFGKIGGEIEVKIPFIKINTRSEISSLNIFENIFNIGSRNDREVGSGGQTFEKRILKSRSTPGSWWVGILRDFISSCGRQEIWQSSAEDVSSL